MEVVLGVALAGDDAGPIPRPAVSAADDLPGQALVAGAVPRPRAWGVNDDVIIGHIELIRSDGQGYWSVEW
jgi:hypothetical protein